MPDRRLFSDKCWYMWPCSVMTDGLVKHTETPFDKAVKICHVNQSLCQHMSTSACYLTSERYRITHLSHKMTSSLICKHVVVSRSKLNAP